MTRKDVITDFQGVILCGAGHLLHPYVDDEVSPKALLPIGLKPMIHYPLQWLFQAGITDVIVVAHSKSGPKLQKYLGSRGVADGGRAELVLLDDYDGTRAALQSIRDRIKKDIIVVGCDFLTDFPALRLVQHARLSRAGLMMLLGSALSSNFGQQPKAESTEPKHRLSDCQGIYVGLDPKDNQLLCWAHREDLEDDKLNISMSVLSKNPNIRMKADLTDVHCYLIRKDLLDCDVFRKRFSLREDVIPRVIRHQFGRAAAATTIAGAVAGMEERKWAESWLCEALIAETGYCLRANSIAAFAEASKQMARISAAQGIRLVSQAAEISPKAQIGGDSSVGDHTVIGDRSSVKRSVVGHRVAIGNNVKISNSIIMDYAVIEDNCKVEGTVVGMKALVREKSFLKDCDVGREVALEREFNCKGERISSGREMLIDGGAF